jgi:hypothetical protein
MKFNSTRQPGRPSHCCTSLAWRYRALSKNTWIIATPGYIASIAISSMQHDRAECVRSGDFQHSGVAGLRVDRAMDIDPLASTGLRDGNLSVLCPPAAYRTSRMRRVHRIGEHHHFIGRALTQHGLVFLNEIWLLRRVELARDRPQLAVFDAQPVRQHDQLGSLLVRNAAYPGEPGANLVRAPRRGSPRSTSSAVPGVPHSAGKQHPRNQSRKPLDAVVMVQPVPGPRRVVVQQQHLGHHVAVHSVSQPHQRVRSARRPARRRPVPSQLDQVSTESTVREATSDHAGHKSAHSRRWQAIRSGSR